MSNDFVKYNLPETWVWTTIGELGIVVSGGTPSTKEPRFWGGEIPWITPADLSGHKEKYIAEGRRSITNLGVEYSSAKLLPPGTILFSSRAPIGYVAIAKKQLTTNQGFKNLIPLDSIHSDYLYYYLTSVKSLAESMANGTTFLELSSSNFSKIPIPLPPLLEQYRIVTKIEELLSKIDKAEQTLNETEIKLNVCRQAIFKSAFEGKFTTELRKNNENENSEQLIKQIELQRTEAYQQELEKWKLNIREAESTKLAGEKVKKPQVPKFIPVQDEELAVLPKIPKSWKWEKIGNFSFVTKLAGFEFSKLVKYKRAGDIPVIKAQNITKNGLEENYDSYVNKETLEALPRIHLKGGEMLFVFIGAGIGNIGIVPYGKKYLLGPNVAMIRPDTRVLTSFVKYFLSSSLGKKHIATLTKSTAQGSISMENIRNIFVPIAPKIEQQHIVQEIEYRLTVLFNSENTIRQSLLKLNLYKASMLNYSFKGKLVTQALQEESAEIYLNKLRIEKSTKVIDRANYIKSNKKKSDFMQKRSILEILKSASQPKSAKDVWLESEHKDDIEAFYSELKKVQDKIIEVEKGILKLKDEN